MVVSLRSPMRRRHWTSLLFFVALLPLGCGEDDAPSSPPIVPQPGDPAWTWERPLAAGSDLRAVWSDGFHAYAVGQNGIILHFDGSRWRRSESGVHTD